MRAFTYCDFYARLFSHTAFLYTKQRRRNAASLQSLVAQSDRIAAHHPTGLRSMHVDDVGNQ